MAGSAPMALSWSWQVGDREVLAELDVASRVETVRVARRVVSRSPRGGMPDGHAFPIARPTDPSPVGAQPFRDAPTAQILVRFDPSARTFTLTSNGALVLPVSVPIVPPDFDSVVAPATLGGTLPARLFIVPAVALIVGFIVFSASRRFGPRERDHFQECIADSDVACAERELAGLRTSGTDRFRLAIAEGQFKALAGDINGASDIELQASANRDRLDARGRAELDLLMGDIAAASDREKAKTLWNQALATPGAELGPRAVSPGRLRRLEELHQRSIRSAAELRPLLAELFATVDGGGILTTSMLELIRSKVFAIQEPAAREKIDVALAVIQLPGRWGSDDHITRSVKLPPAGKYRAPSGSALRAAQQAANEALDLASR